MRRIAFIARSTLFEAPGGDTFQVKETAEHLIASGVMVDIKLSHESINYEDYDILHFFNIIRPADILHHIAKAKKPFAVSTILVDYAEYDKQHRKGTAAQIFRFLPPDPIEYLKTIARWVRGRDKLVSLSFLWKGQRRSIVEILKKANVILPNSRSEYERVVTKYHRPQKHRVVVNGVNTSLFKFDPAVKKDKRLIICVARIEGIKNQLNLIKALNNTSYKLVIIGSPSPNQYSYYKACRKTAAPNVSFTGNIPQRELIPFYQQAGIHVLPSWFETTGLSSLEAAAMGCNIVITEKGDAKEYFGKDACYCDPGSIESILAAVNEAAARNYSCCLRKRIIEHYTWQQATLQTIEAYQQVLSEE